MKKVMVIAKKVWVIFFVIIFYLIDKKHHLVVVPDDLVGFQFNLFTISTILAGFSFTVLGLLLGMHSEKLVQRLGGTDIMVKRSKTIARSLIYFCVTSFLSLFFVVGFDKVLYRLINKFTEITQMELTVLLFDCGISLLAIGICYFVKSVYDVYFLLQKAYEYKEKSDEDNQKFINKLYEKKDDKNKAENEEEDIFT